MYFKSKGCAILATVLCSTKIPKVLQDGFLEIQQNRRPDSKTYFISTVSRKSLVIM